MDGKLRPENLLFYSSLPSKWYRFDPFSFFSLSHCPAFDHKSLTLIRIQQCVILSIKARSIDGGIDGQIGMIIDQRRQKSLVFISSSCNRICEVSFSVGVALAENTDIDWSTV